MNENISAKRPRLCLEQDRVAPDKDCSGMEDYPAECWRFIFPYLPFEDLISVAMSHPVLRQFIMDFLTSGNYIMIDENTVRKLPIEANKTHYKQLGEHTKSLILSGITQMEAFALFPLFADVTKLIFKKMNLSQRADRDHQPIGIRELKIWQCTIPNAFTHSARYPWEYVNWSTLNWCALESLTIIATTGVIQLPYAITNIRLLKIDVTSEIIIEGGWFTDRFKERRISTLEYLSVRRLQPEKVCKNIKFADSLKILECHNAPDTVDEILKWNNLEHVNIHCNWYHVKQLANHFSSLNTIKSYRISCCAPTPGYNLVDSLPDDCLREIMSYLSERDAAALLSVHVRFISLRSEVVIDSNFVKKYPPNKNGRFYSEIARTTKKLTVIDIPEKDFY